MLHIPGYRIVRTLGEGGMATVYLAVQESLSRDVALKVMSPALIGISPGYGDRFLREARIVAKLMHPNIVPVHDVGVHDGLFYLAMTYVPGQDLLRQRDQLSLKQAVTVLQQVALALDYAHQKGYIHGDIKPENILVDDGHALLADFGIARLAGNGGGHGGGTPAYMSPEQAAGATLDQRSDLYSLGVVLFWLVSGRLPFSIDTAGSIAQHAHERIPCLPAEVIPFQAMVDQALAKRPEDRFLTGGDFADALGDVLGHINLNMETDWRDLISRATGPTPDDDIARMLSGPLFTFHPSAPPDIETTAEPTVAARRTPATGHRLSPDLPIWTPEPELTGRFVLRPTDRRFPAPPARGAFWGRLFAATLVLLVSFATFGWIWLQQPGNRQLLRAVLDDGTVGDGAAPLAEQPAGPVTIEPIRSELPGRDDPDRVRAFYPAAPAEPRLDHAGQRALTASAAVPAMADDDAMLTPEPAAPDVANLRDPDPNVGELQAIVAEPGTVQQPGAVPDSAGQREPVVAMAEPIATAEAGPVTSLVPDRSDPDRPDRNNPNAGTPDRPDPYNPDPDPDPNPDPSSLIQEQLKLASAAFQAGRLTAPPAQSAMAYYQQALQLDPDNATAQAGLTRIAAVLAKRGSQALARGDRADANALLQQAVALDPNGRAVQRLAQQLGAEQRAASAKPLLARAQQAHADGALISPAGASAFDLYQQVLQRDWGSHLALRGLAEVEVQLADEIDRLARSGRQDEARSLYRSALQRYPDSADLHDAGRHIGAARQAVERKSQLAGPSQPALDWLRLELGPSRPDHPLALLQATGQRQVAFAYRGFTGSHSVLHAQLYDHGHRRPLREMTLVINGSAGQHQFSIDQLLNGLPDGRYVLELFFAGKRLSSATFQLDGAAY